MVSPSPDQQQTDTLLEAVVLDPQDAINLALAQAEILRIQAEMVEIAEARAKGLATPDRTNVLQAPLDQRTRRAIPALRFVETNHRESWIHAEGVAALSMAAPDV